MLSRSALRTVQRLATSNAGRMTAASTPALRMLGSKAVMAARPTTRVVTATQLALVGLTGFAVMTSADSAVDYDAVRERVRAIFAEDESRGPLFVRLAWHASGTYSKHSKCYGSDGATMRFAPESGHGANAGLGLARSLLEPIKQEFPDISYGDLWVLASIVAIEEMGGPSIKFRPGRTDATSSSACPPDGNLPDAAQGQSHVREIFYRMGFSDREIVALVGAHALGECHVDRSGFSGPWTRAPTTFSNEYFRELLTNTWSVKKWDGPKQFEDPTGDLMMLPADIALRDDAEFRKHCEAFANDEDLFFREFAAAYKRLVELGVKFPEKTGRRRYIFFGPRDN